MILALTLAALSPAGPGFCCTPPDGNGGPDTFSRALTGAELGRVAGGGGEIPPPPDDPPRR
jgi:hypothetical protein